jgi:F-type H+-transporting ATPase subunit c
MELEAAKMIGAGLAAIALAGAGVGIGLIFGNYLSGAMRNNFQKSILFQPLLQPTLWLQVLLQSS